VRARQISSSETPLTSVLLIASFSTVEPTEPTAPKMSEYPSYPKIAGIKCDHSKTSPILFAGNMDKLIVINHGEVPICEKCKHYIDTHISFEPEFIINTGSMLNVPFNFIQLPFNISCTSEKIKIYDVDRFGKLIFIADGEDLLYLPMNNIKSLDCQTIFLVDGKPSACFTSTDGLVIIDQDGKVFRPEILKQSGEPKYNYETPTFTIDYDCNIYNYVYNPLPAIQKTKSAILEIE
jgi:hypothetical protein